MGRQGHRRGSIAVVAVAAAVVTVLWAAWPSGWPGRVERGRPASSAGTSPAPAPGSGPSAGSGSSAASSSAAPSAEAESNDTERAVPLAIHPASRADSPVPAVPRRPAGAMPRAPRFEPPHASRAEHPTPPATSRASGGAAVASPTPPALNGTGSGSGTPGQGARGGAPGDLIRAGGAPGTGSGAATGTSTGSTGGGEGPSAVPAGGASSQPPSPPRIAPPRVLSTAGTAYPGEAFRLVVRRQDLGPDLTAEGAEGAVKVRALVTADGGVRSVEVAASSGSAVLDRAAAAAVRRWQFAPATRDGAPIDAYVVVTIRYVVR